MDLTNLLNQAKSSKFKLWLVNHLLWRMIPFNKPHRFQIVKITNNALETAAPYRHRNFNHLRGIHACAIATIAEFSAGLMLLTHIDVHKYRLILSELKVNYHYQAKKNIISRCKLTLEDIQSMLAELKNDNVCLKTIRTEIYDQENNLVATADLTWQLKSWLGVKTKV